MKTLTLSRKITHTSVYLRFEPSFYYRNYTNISDLPVILKRMLIIEYKFTPTLTK